MRTPSFTARPGRRFAGVVAALSLAAPSVALAADTGSSPAKRAPTTPHAAAVAHSTPNVARATTTHQAAAPAPAPGPAAAAAQPASPNACVAPVSVMQYRKYAKRVYKRTSISHQARHKLRRLERCQTSAKDRHRVKRYKTRYMRDRHATTCSQSNVVSCIRDAARKYRVSFPMLLRKARCESGLNPYATNGAHDGLFQFRTASPSTWGTTPYAGKSYWTAKWNALAAAWMHAQGRGAEWECR
jgi:hypothetical protein